MNSKDYKKIITEIYKQYNADKIFEVEKLLFKYKGQEEELLQSIFTKYNISTSDQSTFYNLSLNQTPNISTIGNEFINERLQFHEDLKKLKYLHEKGEIDNNKYLKEKDSIKKKIEILNYNEQSVNQPSSSKIETETITQTHKSKNSIFLWLLILLLFFSLLYVIYDSKTNSINLDKISTLFSSHSKDQEEIKNRIEQTYFGLMNGEYMASNFKGLKQEDLPFFNTNIQALLVMGLGPYMTLGGYKFEPINIDVYDFIDDNNAKVKYGLVIKSPQRVDTSYFDITVKKIGGSWKLDAEQIFRGGIKDKKDINKDLEKTNQEALRNADLNDAGTFVYRVVGENEYDSEGETTVSRI